MFIVHMTKLSPVPGRVVWSCPQQRVVAGGGRPDTGASRAKYLTCRRLKGRLTAAQSCSGFFSPYRQLGNAGGLRPRNGTWEGRCWEHVFPRLGAVEGGHVTREPLLSVP